MTHEITKQNAALTLIDGRGLDAFGGSELAAALLTVAREKASRQVLGDGPRWHAAIDGLEQHARALRRRLATATTGTPGNSGSLGSDAPVQHHGAIWRGDLAAPRIGPVCRSDRPLDSALAANEHRPAPRLGGCESGRPGSAAPILTDSELSAAVKTLLLDLCPWRKGPFQVMGVELDAEWRCDQKWARVVNAVSIAGKTVLDVGCGNGYYVLRALGAGARAALGIDPTWLYVAQFGALRRVIAPIPSAGQQLPGWVLPLALEDLRPPLLPVADVVVSMGVLYHRKSPIEHLEALRDVVRPGGKLVLETLVVPGDERTVLVPRDRYAAMRNVWMLPSVSAVRVWLERCGYVDVEVADISATSTAEQRATEFMQSASLAQFLNPADATLTVEGYPAPTRALLVATRP